MMHTILFLSLVLGGFILTKLLIYYSRKHQLLDIANHRSSHTIATPRIGGLSFVFLISICIAVDACFIQPDKKWVILLGILLPCLIVALTALMDDIKSLSQSQRFLLYFASSLIAVYFFKFESTILCLSIIFSIVLAVAFNWLINLFNFMDGIDGIAASEAIFVLSALVYFTASHGPINSAKFLTLYIAPVIGFLLLNWQPAKIFMGDAGSTFLGCLLGCLLLQAINEGQLNIYSAIILLGCFLVDATWTLIYRLISGQKWYQAHRSHSYQILSRRFGSHQTVTFIYSLVNIGWIFPLSVYAHKHESYGLLITTICFLPLVLVCFIIGAGQKANN